MLDLGSIAIGLAQLALPLVICHEYEQAVKFHKGKAVKLYTDPGIVWYWPIIQSVDTKSVVEEVVATNGVRLTLTDDRTYRISIAIRYRIFDLRLWYVGVQDFDESLIERAEGVLSHALRDASSISLRTDRLKLEARIRRSLARECKGWGVELLGLRFVDITRTRVLDLGLEGMTNAQEVE